MPTDPSTATIARLRGEFSSAVVESGFLYQQSGTILRYLRRALLLCSLFYIMFGINDIAVLGLDAALRPLAARLVVPLLALLAWRHIRRAADTVRAAFRVSSLFMACWMVSYLIVIQHRPLDTMLHAMSMLIIVIFIQVFIPNRPLHSLAIALGGSIAFLALAWVQHVESARHLASITMLIVFANVFGALATNRYARLWREQYRAQQVLTKLAIRDPLTGCYNRRHLNDALLEGEIARARRYRLGLALLMCDLDGFKAINDTHGHLAGDELLRDFAGLLQAMTRESVDTVVRYGGEEFLVILPETSLEGARELAERIRAACAARRVECGKVTLAATASFGVVGADFATADAILPRELIAAADESMYAAKRAGRNRVEARPFVATP